MMRARNPLTRALLVLLSLSFALPVLYAQEKNDPNASKSRVAGPVIQYRERHDDSGVNPR